MDNTTNTVAADPTTHRQFIEAARKYASYTADDIIINDPSKYKTFRDGQDSAYSIIKAENEALKEKLRLAITVGVETYKSLNDKLEAENDLLKSARSESMQHIANLNGEITELREANTELIELLTECYGDYSHSHFTDRRGMAPRLKQAIAKHTKS